MKPRRLWLLALLLVLTGPAHAASDFTFTSPELQKPRLLAQADGDESYDPFSDYSEFDEASDEEADINFFRNGRLFVLGFQGGYRTFTDVLGKLYMPGPTYGLFMTFFFDLRFALQFAFLTGDHSYEFKTDAGKITGNVSMTFLDLSLKYFINTQNVTRGLADLNPYILGGFSQVYRTLSLKGTGDSAHDATMGLHIGGGIEIPLMRKKAFFGIQGMYRYFNFKDANQNAIDPNTQVEATPATKPHGNSYDITGILGLNF